MTFALVTGGAGFIGSHLVETLLKKGSKVRVLDNFSTGFERNLEKFISDVEILRGDLREIALLEKALQGIDVVFHAAAIPSVPRSVKEPLLTTEVNLLGSLKILECARQARVRRVVFSSSSSVYGESPILPKEETQVTSPLSPYAVSKLTVERFGSVYSQIYQLEVVSLRYFNVYGPRQDPLSDYAAVIPSFLKAAQEGKPPIIYGDGKQTRDFTFVEDVVQANLLAALKDQVQGQVFNIAGGKQVSILDLARIVGEITKTSMKPILSEARSGDVRHSHASIAKAKDALGWQPQVSLEDGIRRTYEWVCQSQP